LPSGAVQGSVWFNGRERRGGILMEGKGEEGNILIKCMFSSKERERRGGERFWLNTCLVQEGR
jgi:hypothetical protein